MAKVISSACVVLLLFMLLFVIAPVTSAASKNTGMVAATPTPVATQSAEAQAQEHNVQTDSFTLFWPLTAGKTQDESMYFLKTFKENLRGLLVFGNAEKANYNVFLATKRLLETEKLFSEGKKDIAEATVARGIVNLKNASNQVDSSKGEGAPINSEMLPRLENMQILLEKLEKDNSESQLVLKQFQSEANNILNKSK